MAESASIRELLAMLVDAYKGYDEAIHAAEPHLKALFEKAKSVHEKAHAAEVKPAHRAKQFAMRAGLSPPPPA